MFLTGLLAGLLIGIIAGIYFEDTHNVLNRKNKGQND